MRLSSGMKTALSVLAALTSTSFAQSVQHIDPATNLGLALSTAANGSATDLYLHLQAPVSAGWGSFGIGGQMNGALFFVLYPNAAKSGVTVSVRGTSGHAQPQVLAGVSYSVVSSTITSSLMTADVICYACTKWSGGSLDPTSSSAPWIWAVGPGSAVSSDSLSASLSQHSSSGSFKLNMVAAQKVVGSADSSSAAAAATSSSAAAAPSSSSPIAAATSAAASSSAAMSSASAPAPSSVVATPTSAVTTPASVAIPTLNTAAPNTNTNTNTGAGASSPSDTATPYNTLLIAHAVLLPLAFVILLPLGVLLLRLSAHIPVRLHYITQSTALVCALLGFVLALAYSALGYGGVYSTYHQVIGIVAVLLLVGQAAGGLVHHLAYKKRAKAGVPRPGRTVLATAHVWLGRGGIALGIVNAVLGFVLAGSTGGAIAVAVVGAVVYGAVGAVVMVKGKGAKGAGERARGQRIGSDATGREMVEMGVKK